MFGLWIADFHAAGFVRKIQDSWKLTVFIELVAMALALIFISGGRLIANPADQVFASFTVHDGRYGWNAATVWPRYMLLSNW